MSYILNLFCKISQKPAVKLKIFSKLSLLRIALWIQTKFTKLSSPENHNFRRWRLEHGIYIFCSRNLYNSYTKESLQQQQYLTFFEASLPKLWRPSLLKTNFESHSRYKVNVQNIELHTQLDTVLHMMSFNVCIFVHYLSKL